MNPHNKKITYRNVPVLILFLAAVLFLLLAVVAARAQTNTAVPTISGGVQEIADAIGSSTNWTIVGGAGRATHGNRDIAFGALAYSFNQNVGLLLGGDYLWSPHQDQASSENVIRGGVTLQAPIHPFTFLGSGGGFLTNLVAEPFVVAAVANPTGGSKDSIGTVGTVGLNFELLKIKNFELVAGGQYETRSGAGFYNGNYVLFHLGIGRRF